MLDFDDQVLDRNNEALYLDDEVLDFDKQVLDCDNEVLGKNNQYQWPVDATFGRKGPIHGRDTWSDIGSGSAYGNHNTPFFDYFTLLDH